MTWALAMASSAGRKCPVTRAYPNTEEPDRCDAEQHHRGRVPDQVVGQQIDVVADLVQVEHFMLRALALSYPDRLALYLT